MEKVLPDVLGEASTETIAYVRNILKIHRVLVEK
jgi:hypothetical protein